jgi:hypothetical protein
MKALDESAVHLAGEHYPPTRTHVYPITTNVREACWYLDEGGVHLAEELVALEGAEPRDPRVLVVRRVRLHIKEGYESVALKGNKRATRGLQERHERVYTI